MNQQHYYFNNLPKPVTIELTVEFDDFSVEVEVVDEEDDDDDEEDAAAVDDEEDVVAATLSELLVIFAPSIMPS